MESAGWRRKGMSCLVEGCGTGMKRGLTVGDVGRSSRKQWFWMLKNMHLVFSRLKNSRLLFCLPAEFYSAVFGSRCDIPWKDQT